MCWVNHDAEWEGGKSVAISINNQLTVDLFNCRKSFSPQRQQPHSSSGVAIIHAEEKKVLRSARFPLTPKVTTMIFRHHVQKELEGDPQSATVTTRTKKNCFSKDFFPRSFLCVIQKVLLFYYQQRPGLLFQSGSVWWRDMCVNMRMSIIVRTLDSR